MGKLTGRQQNSEGLCLVLRESILVRADGYQGHTLSSALDAKVDLVLKCLLQLQKWNLPHKLEDWWLDEVIEALIPRHSEPDKTIISNNQAYTSRVSWTIICL